MLHESVGLAVLVVLDSLTPAERVAFVLHEAFAVPFGEIALIVDRSPAAARQLASRARRRVEGAPVPDASLSDQWAVADAFRAAARDGDFDRLLALLDPDVVVTSAALSAMVISLSFEVATSAVVADGGAGLASRQM